VDPDLVALPPADVIRASLARDCLADFVWQAWPLVEPGTSLSWNWHLDELCSALELVTLGELKRLVINIPPGTGKSLIVSVFWPAWEWATDPGLRYLTASYTDDNTVRDNRRLRSIVSSDWYRRHFGVKLSSDQWAKVRFDTTAKGWRIASSVGGMGTGEHPDRIIIDDPHKAKEVPSSTARDAVGEWFESTISTRIARDPAFVVVMQRLHQDDLTGRLLAKGGWEHLLFPMRYEPEGRWDCPCHQAPDPRDVRTDPRELLWPSLWPEDKVRDEEIDLGPFGTSGQLQQRPVPVGGGLFKREWFTPVEAGPSKARRCRGWDTAGTEGGGDWTVGVKLAETKDGEVVVEDVIRAQVGPGAVDALILQTAQLDGKDCMVREEQEPGSAGKAVVQARAKSLKGYDYGGVTISGDKVTRAKPFRAQCEAGNVRMVRGGWNDPYLTVMTSFPVGEHDDDADASSCAYNALVSDKPKQTRATWGPRRRY
jgi:predicted phage terminase large subunit-like protein